MMLVLYIIIVLLLIITLFVLNVVSCCFALGRMHVWLKGKAEVFGDDEGLRDELADIRGHVIECRNEVTKTQE